MGVLVKSTQCATPSVVSDTISKGKYNFVKNLDKGSSSLPLVSECKGIVNDFSNGCPDDVTFKASMLGMYTMSILNFNASKTMQLGL